MSTATLVRGQSEIGQYIDQQSDQVGQHFNQTAVFNKLPAHEEMLQIWQECNAPDWDGNGALPIQAETLLYTYLFIESLPIGCELPSVGVEPDGELTLEWYRHSKWLLSVSVSPTGVLTYVALLGSSNSRGSTHFINTIPAILMTLIQTVISYA